MQNYKTDPSRNVSIAAGRVGGNQSQGAGIIPGKVAVNFPQAKPAANVGGKKGSVAGFSGGVIPGKI